MHLELRKAGVALAALAAVAVATPAGAVAGSDASKVQLLVAQIGAALSRVGCTATTEQDVLAIEQVIIAAGASPSEAEAALRTARSLTSVCGDQAGALGAVEQTITLALARSDPAGGPLGGLAFGGPNGAPPVFVGTQPQDYQH
jgi:hypothetical protein